MLQEPHHPDVVERLVLERERESVGLAQGRLDPGPREVLASEVELLRLDVDAEQPNARELLPEHREHRAHARADLEQPRPRLELRPVPDQPVPPVLGLLHEPLLLGRSIAVDVAGHGRTCGNRQRFSTPRVRVARRLVIDLLRSRW